MNISLKNSKIVITIVIVFSKNKNSSGCHGLLLMSLDVNNIAIITIKGVDFRKFIA